MSGEPPGDPSAFTREIMERFRTPLHRDLHESDEKYRSLFDSIDQGFCIVEVLFDDGLNAIDYRFLEANPAFGRQTGLYNAMGKRVRELIPHHEPFWFKTYGRIALTGEPVRFEHRAEELNRHYEVYAFRIGAPGLRRVAILFNDIAERKQTETALRASEAALRRNSVWLSAQKQAFQIAMDDQPLEESLGVLIRAVVNTATDGRRCAFYIDSHGANTLTHVVGMPPDYAKAVDGFRISPESLACGLAVATGQPVITRDVLEEPRWQPWTWLAREHDYRGCWSFPVQTSGGRLVGSFAVYFQEPREPDVNDLELASVVTQTAAIIISRHQADDVRRQMEEQQQVLVGELQHRTRNLMGVVSSMADKTARTSRDLADFEHRFGDRLDALARVQGLLSRINRTERLTFDELIRTELTAMNGNAERVTLDGPAGVPLRSSMVQILALALHELATNAMKYGALGQPRGRLDITWRHDVPDAEGRSRLHIDWRERNVTLPYDIAFKSKSGQGRELIEQALAYQLGAKVNYRFETDGVHCTISIPIVDPGAKKPAATPAAAAKQPSDSTGAPRGPVLVR